jgi:uncharacterized FlgJ-related protein
MLYIYNRKTLEFRKVKMFKAIVVFISINVMVALFSFYQTRYVSREYVVSHLTQEEKLIVINQGKEVFSQSALVQLLKDLNVKFPHIVLAQSILETGHWTSAVFKENHNLFGMKQAQRRVNTAKGTQLNHAYYESWEESVYDYAFYQCRYLSSINSEQEYFQYLQQNYAEAPNYVNSVRTVIENENLRELFK